MRDEQQRKPNVRSNRKEIIWKLANLIATYGAFRSRSPLSSIGVSRLAPHPTAEDQSKDNDKAKSIESISSLLRSVDWQLNQAFRLSFKKMVAKHIWYTTLLLMAPILATAAAIDLPTTLSLMQATNLSAAKPANGLNSTQAIRCTKKPTWMSPQFNKEDCNSALLYLYMEEMYDLGWMQTSFEFLDKRAAATTDLKKQWMPRKYVFRMFNLHGGEAASSIYGVVTANSTNSESCAIGIAMTGAFPSKELPYGRRVRLLSDVATWKYVYQSAEAVYRHCVERSDIPGWLSTGKRYSISCHFSSFKSYS